MLERGREERGGREGGRKGGREGGEREGGERREGGREGGEREGGGREGGREGGRKEPYTQSQLTSSISEQELKYLETVEFGGIVQSRIPISILGVEHLFLLVPGEPGQMLSHHIFTTVSSCLETAGEEMVSY